MKHLVLFFTLVVLLLLTSSIRVNAKTLSPLQEINKAAELGDELQFKKLVGKSKIDLNSQDEEGMTPLMSAASGGNLAITKYLIEKKAPLETKNKLGDTALTIAVMADHTEVVQQLLKAGAQSDQRVAGDTNDTLLIVAAKSNLKLTRLLLNHDKSLLNKTNQAGDTALIESIRYGYNDIAKYLLSHGADKTIKNKAQKKAADIAKEYHNRDAQKLLKSK